MNILVISGIWPPNVGGPASHAPEVCEYLLAHGHRVEAVTMASRPPAQEAYPVHWTSGRTPLVVRHLAAARLIGKLAARADVVYTTGMIGRSGLGAALAGTPTVVKLTSDPVFERSLRWGLFSLDLAAFQNARGVRIEILRRARDLVLKRARRIVVPSEALKEFAVSWGIPAEKITLIRNPVAVPDGLECREELRRRHTFEGPTLVFAGRLVPQKSIDVALEAIRRNPDVRLVLAGEGPSHEQLVRQARDLGVDGRAAFLGSHPRRTVFELLRAADAALLSSSWENFPHMVVEALAVGTPVIATDAGGVSEILRDEWNGLLVPIRDPKALSEAIRRYLDDPALQQRLRAESVSSVAQFDPEEIYAQLEHVLADVAQGR